jgi:hypothetical protein
MKVTKVKSGDGQVLVEPKPGLSRQGRYSGGRSTYYYSGALENIFFLILKYKVTLFKIN